MYIVNMRTKKILAGPYKEWTKEIDDKCFIYTQMGINVQVRTLDADGGTVA
jgi:hypothetical protein